MDRSARAETPTEKALTSSGLSLLRLEHLTGIPRSTLRRNISNPLRFSIGDLHRFAAATGVDGAELFAQIAGEAE